MSKAVRKSLYFQKLKNYFTSFSKFFIVNADNVGSLQLQQVRMALRDRCEILMGKNTMIRKALNEFILDADRKDLECILPLVRGNIGFIFTNDDLAEIRDIFVGVAVGAPAKAGVTSQCDVSIPPGSTGLDPSKTNFFQALNISTKIVKGTIEISNEVHILKRGEKVGPSEAALLKMLDITPFKYFLQVVMIFDNGSLFENAVLDIKDEDIVSKFMQSVATVAAVSLEICFPTVVSVPHSLINTFKNALAIAVETDYSFRQAEKAKAYLANPEAFAVAAAPATATNAAPAAAAAPEPEEESDEDMGFSLFD